MEFQDLKLYLFFFVPLMCVKCSAEMISINHILYFRTSSMHSLTLLGKLEGSHLLRDGGTTRDSWLLRNIL